MGLTGRIGLMVALSATLMAANVGAKDLSVGVPRSVPPYVIPETWGGIEYEVAKQSLALAGYTITPKLTVPARVPKEMNLGNIDAGLAKLKASGEFDRIVSRYLAQMEANLAQAGK
ncbi:MAG: hypothetical protein LDL39_02980 [Magnetospirillum sp.]|nr:hypothetical protein [Magnetospirillum sp.]